MRVAKGKTTKTAKRAESGRGVDVPAKKAKKSEKSEKSEKAQKAAEKKVFEKKALEQALVEEVAGTHTSALKLRTIVERLLGVDDDADVRALVLKLAKASRSETTGPY